MPDVLIIDDDAAIGKVLVGLLRQDGLSAQAVTSASAGLERLGRESFSAVLTDLRMPEIDGFGVLDRVRALKPGTPVIMITAHGTIAAAVDAMRRGAADFLTKPFDRAELLFVLRKALALQKGGPGDSTLFPELAEELGLLGAAPPILEVVKQVRQVAPTPSTVLLTGETGTGKELFARAIHRLSPRREKPFAKVVCAEVPENLLESELFGYARGAFTGAIHDKPGRVELADGGTLFLDEIADTPPALQVKLLRVLQDREFERLGATDSRRVDLRVIAATHRDLGTLVKEGKFREDLFYRLNVVPIHLPPLRERRSDVPALAQEFVRRLVARDRRGSLELTPEAQAVLQAHDWPGNIRELEHTIERLVVLGQGATIEAEAVRAALGTASRSAPSPAAAGGPPPETLAASVADAERTRILEALAACNQNRTAAAKRLGISRRTLQMKMKGYGIT